MPEITLNLSNVFKPLFEKYRFKVYASGRGAGKSWAFARALLVKALQEREVLILCCREVQRSIEDSVYALLRKNIELLGLSPYFDLTTTAIVCRVSGSRFKFKGLYNDRAADTIKSLEGAKYCWVEEAQAVSEHSLEILVPTIRESESELWFSLNPRFREDAVWQMFFADRSKRPANSLIRQISWRDNPDFPTVLREEMDHDKKLFPARFLHVWEGGLKSAAGDLLKREWWRTWNSEDPETYSLQFVSADTAFSKSNSADYSVLQLWAMTADFRHLDLLDSWRGRWNYPELLQKTKDFYQKHSESRDITGQKIPMGALVIENKASGQSLLQSLNDEGFTVYGYLPPGDKVLRVNSSIPSVFHGRVRIPPEDYAPWVSEFLAETAAFSDDLSHPHDDQVDAFTQAEAVWRETVANA